MHRNLCLIPLWHHLPCLLPQQSSTGGVQEPAVLQHPPTRISSSEQVHTSLHVNHLQSHNLNCRGWAVADQLKSRCLSKGRMPEGTQHLIDKASSCPIQVPRTAPCSDAFECDQGGLTPADCIRQAQQQCVNTITWQSGRLGHGAAHEVITPVACHGNCTTQPPIHPSRPDLQSAG